MLEAHLSNIIQGVLLPALIGGGAFLISQLLPGILRSTVRVAGVAGGLLVSYVLLIGVPEWPLAGSPKGIAATALVATLLPLIDERNVQRVWLRRFIIIALIAVVCLNPFVPSSWGYMASLQTVSLIATIGVFIWYFSDRAASQMHPSSQLVVWLLTLTAASLHFLFEGSASVAQLVGAFCSALGAVFVFTLIPYFRLGTELNGLLVCVTTSLWLSHLYYSEAQFSVIPWFLAPHLIFVGRIFSKKPMLSKWNELTITSILALLPLAWVVWQSYQAYSQE